jgi:hypothetical protein
MRKNQRYHNKIKNTLPMKLQSECDCRLMKILVFISSFPSRKAASPVNERVTPTEMTREEIYAGT